MGLIDKQKIPVTHRSNPMNQRLHTTKNDWKRCIEATEASATNATRSERPKICKFVIILFNEGFNMRCTKYSLIRPAF